ncbi:MAG: metalloregulator ArsR/SmtB family transcription factor [Sphingomonas sp.]|jgi:DNA-binding transcriptional ArsR family regulator
MSVDLHAADLNRHAELLRAIAHAVRLDLLRMLAGGERSVSDLEQATGIIQPGLSQQLAILRKADLVLTRREAKQVFYRINHARFADLSALLDAFADTIAIPRGETTASRMASGGGAAMFARMG